MNEGTDPHLKILLDIQRQIGDIKSETTMQSAQLTSLNDKVAIQNGKVFKSMQDIQTIKDEKNVAKGKTIILIAVGGFIMSIVGGIIAVVIKSKIGA